MKLRKSTIVGLSYLMLSAAAWGFQAGQSVAVLASGEHESGAKVELLAVKRDSATVVTVRWRYRNDSDAPEQLTKQRTGGIDPYRLSLDTYLLDEVKHIKYPVSRDTDNHPAASRNGSPNQYITLRPKATMEVWAKYFVPESTGKVTVAIDGVSPFGGIAIGR